MKDNKDEGSTYSSDETLPVITEGSSDLARWNEIVQKIDLRKFKTATAAIEQFIAEEQRLLPHELLYLNTMKIYCHIRSNNLKGATEELNVLGALDGDAFQYESYPELYPDKRGCMTPFFLRILSSCIHIFLGTDTLFLDQIYRVLQLATKQLNESASPVTHTLWASRVTFITHMLARYHIEQGRFVEAIRLMKETLKQNPNCLASICLLGRIYLRMGAIDAASHYFAEYEQKASKNDLRTTKTNQALIALAEKNYSAAKNYLREAMNTPDKNEQSEQNQPLTMYPTTDAVAVSNLAVGLLYNSNLSEAVNYLDGFVISRPVTNAFSTSVKNAVMLCEFSVNKEKCINRLSNKIIRQPHGFLAEDGEIRQLFS